jgi:S-adenosylmethionine synthetase
MFGYATNETKELLPIPFVLATRLIKNYEERIVARDTRYKYDSKSQVSYDYNRKRIINVNLSVQHSSNLSLEELRENIKALIVKTIEEFQEENKIEIFDDLTEIVINNAGTFTIGGAIADAGLTGRKIIADTYGGYGRHGGGAFSGKDYTKVDRSAAYYARYVSNKIVKNNLADIVEIQVSYIIGNPHPIAVDVEMFETNKVPLEEIYEFINGFDFSLSNIIKELKLKELDYRKTSIHGHFGKKDLP